ncbi:protein DENND6B [Selaginella moellendorffii]|nr:protein DENND6B [Selaginella moellendorffii]|eukprot:XP_002993637.2 protein DENND6B [Selaginella moellendorffii]
MVPWLVALCALRFDVEQGQVMDYCFPPDRLTEIERSHIALCAFPDSQQQRQRQHSSQRTAIHDSVFFFRIPRSSGAKNHKHLFGYVFNRQRQDERLIRGGDQKSVVILSYFPYWSSIFKPLVQIAGPLFFDSGSAALERISSIISSTWPPPPPNPKIQAGLELPVVNMVIRVTNLAPLPDQGIVFHDVDLFAVLKGVLMQLWLLWELALVGEPLLVVAPSPSVSCEAVAAISSLLAPIPCSSDLRPYFTIHDPDFHTDLAASSSILLGVTNLFFLPAFSSSKRLPSVVSLLDPHHHHHQFQQLKKFVDKKPWSSLPWTQRRHSQAVWSTHAPATKPDTSVLNRLVDAIPSSPRMDESMSLVNSDILRRHFEELTTNFLAPIAPYFAVPSSGSNNPFVDPPPLPAFDEQRFLSALATRGPGKFLAKRLRSNWIDLYRRFLRGPNFMPWFRSRRANAEREQRRIWRQARARADVRTIVSKMPELELVETFNAILRHLVAELDLQMSQTQSFPEKLRADLRVVFDMLPKDTQQLLLLNPQHASLLDPKTSNSSGISRSSSGSSSTKLPGRPSIHISWSSQATPAAPLSLSRRNSPLALSGRLAQELASDPLDLDKA